MSSNSDHILQSMLAEYNSLRTEVQNRTAAQNILLQLHITALTAILGAILADRNFGPWLIFLVPIESAIFGLWWIDHATKIEEVGQFIGDVENKIGALLGHADVMTWESNFARDPYPDVAKPRPVRPGDLFKWTFGRTCAFALIVGLYFLLFNRPVYASEYFRAAWPAWLIGLVLYISYYQSVKYLHNIGEKRKEAAKKSRENLNGNEAKADLDAS